MNSTSINQLVHSLKSSNSTSESGQISIVDNEGLRIGCLKPITKSLASDEKVVEKLTKWRRMFKRYFLTQFTPTSERTKNWLDSVVMPSDNRILFLICTDSNEIVGNFGVCDLTESQAELDNLIRGEKGGHPQLIYFAELALLKWIFDDLGIPTACLHVFSNNYKTIALHESVGFKTVASYPLAKQELQDELKYAVCDSSNSDVIDFSYLEMRLASTEFRDIYQI